MSDGNETIEHRIKGFAQTLLSPQDPQLTIRLVYDLLTQVVDLLCSAFPEKTDAIQAELKSKFIDVQLYAETFRLGFSEAQSGALRRAGNLETVAQIEPTNDDAVACPDNCTDSSEAQLHVPVDQPIENASTTERILRDNTGNRDQEGVSREYSDRQSRQLSLPSSHGIFEASSRQPSSPDNQNRTNAEHENGDDFHTLNRNGDLPTCVGQDTRPADVLTSTQPRQSKQQERVPGSDPTGPSPQTKPSGPGDEIRYEMQDGILRFLPTENQYQNFSRLIQFARELGAHQTGAVKILVPNCSTRYPLSPPARNLTALQNRFSIQSRNNGTFEVTRSSRRAPLPSVSQDNADITTDDHVRNFESLLQTPNWFRGVEYYVDLDAHSKEQRRRLGFPPDSPIFPLQGNRLSQTRTAVPGIHTPYAYWSGLKFGAPFAMHVEDCWLSSVNYLYAGEKIWFIVEPQHLKILEDKLRAETREKPCSQFLRHDASYSTKSCLEEWGVSYKVLSQKPGEIVYTFGRAYHQGFSAGPTIAEAVNFAEEDWTTDGYQFCKEESCPRGSILSGMMDLCSEGKPQNDLAQENETEEEYDDSNGEDNDDEDDDDDVIAKKNRRFEEKRTKKGKAPRTGRKRKSRKEEFSEREQKRRTTVLVRHAEVQEAALPPEFVTPAEIVKQLAQTQIEQKNVLTLSWYFFNIGSPRALLKLHEAFTASRTRKSSSLQDSTNATGHVVRSLDALDDKQFAIVILRRYYLVRLVQCRDDAVAIYQQKKLTRNHAQRSNERFSTLALDHLMGQGYPTLSREDDEYEKRRKSLQNKITYGRNWHDLVQEFGYGILALVPLSEENPNSSFERLSRPVMKCLIRFLKDHRGKFLRQASELINDHLLSIINGEEKDRKYRFEQEGYDILSVTFDSPQLLGLCGVEET